MHEVDVQPALHHAMRRDRRIDTAREQRQAASRYPDRQTAGAGNFSRRNVGALGKDLDRNRQLGIFEVDFETEFIGDRAADLPIDLHRIEREALVVAPGADAESFRAMSARAGNGLARDGFDIERARDS